MKGPRRAKPGAFSKAKKPGLFASLKLRLFRKPKGSERMKAELAKVKAELKARGKAP